MQWGQRVGCKRGARGNGLQRLLRDILEPHCRFNWSQDLLGERCDDDQEVTLGGSIDVLAGKCPSLDRLLLRNRWLLPSLIQPYAHAMSYMER